MQEWLKPIFCTYHLYNFQEFLKKNPNIKRGHYQSLTYSIWSQLHTAQAVGNSSVLLFLLTVIY